MSKELEAKTEDISKLLYEVYDVPSRICEQIKSMIERLEAIDNSNPTESLESLEKFFNSRKIYEPNNTIIFDCITYLNSIKQALIIKSKKEKAGEILKEIINDGYMYCDIDEDYYITLDGQVSLSKEKLKLLKELIKDGQDTDN